MRVDIEQLIAAHGSPLYVYDLEIVRQRARALRSAINYDNTAFHYAIKANPCPAVVRCLQAEGYGIDAVSPGEVALALKLGFSAEQILYTENNMTDSEMHEALDNNVLINCGSLQRLERCAAAGATRAAVRFNPDVIAGAHEKICTAGPLTKFGVAHSQVDQVQKIEEASKLRVVGCHMHIGSGILDADLYVQAMDVILEVAKQLPHLEFINFGGGLGIPYGPDDQAINLEKLGAAADTLMNEFCTAYGRPLQLRLEPGRFLVGECGSLYTQVTSVKENPDGRIFVGCNTGFNHLIRPCMYDSYHHIDNCTHPDNPPVTCDIVGNICESGDIFARQRTLPQCELDDILAIRDAGAYGMSMASTYNMRPLPAEIVVDGDQHTVAREAQNYQQLFAAWNL